MRLRAILLGVLAFYVLHVACEHGRTKRSGLQDFLGKLGKKVLTKVLKDSAQMIMKKGAMGFLEQAEAHVLQEMIRQMEYEKVHREMREKLIKVSLMMNATLDVYARNYDCDVGTDYIKLTFKFGLPNIPKPEKWILKFFTEEE